ncbi:glycoside hydrolase family 20 zincin-like fold domain-containing protein [Rubritalea tangerina]|uniref:Glycoside hydrolase family 20 zincin-like fold domain-containing protein n=1 Tax=Rubritalea tangerina TaxID=430798 RepID=A0ABW4Z6S3_9BACT
MKKLFLLGAMALSWGVHAQGDELGFIPKPMQVQRVEGKALKLSGALTVSVDVKHQAAVKAGLERLGMPVRFEKGGDIKVLDDTSLPHREAYRLEVKPEGIVIKAKSSAGVYYALQTLLQAMPVEVFDASLEREAVEVPLIEVQDAPRFGWPVSC